MNGLHLALREVHGKENDLAATLLEVAERQHVEHEVHHVTRDLAAWASEHVTLLAEHAARTGLDLDEEAKHPHQLGHRLRAAFSITTGRRPSAGLLLLEDLRNIYLLASDTSLAWETLAQVAQAEHNQDLLDLTEQCHPQTLRAIRWSNTMLKVQTPQALASL